MTIAILALIAGTARLGIFIGLHLVPNEYSMVRHAVSDYAVGSTRRLSSIMTWLTTGFWALLAWALWVNLPDWPDLTSIIIALLILAVIFAVLPFVPTTLEGEKLTAIAKFHYLLAIAWFAISYGCMGNFTRLFAAEGPTWLATGLGIIKWVAAISLAVSVVALLITHLRPTVFGISERIFLLAVSLFYIGVAIGLVIIASREHLRYPHRHVNMTGRSQTGSGRAVKSSHA